MLSASSFHWEGILHTLSHLHTENAFHLLTFCLFISILRNDFAT
jgi:hypothetical protein